MDDSSVDHHSGESKVAILMFTLLAVVVLLGTIGAYSYSGSLMVEEELSRGEALIWVGQEYISMVILINTGTECPTPPIQPRRAKELYAID